MSEADNYSPVLLTVDSQGRITAEFAGHVTAAGVDLPEGIGNILADPEQPDSKVQWIKDGVTKGYVLHAYESTFNEDELRLVALSDGTRASVIAYAGTDPSFPGGAASAQLIDSDAMTALGILARPQLMGDAIGAAFPVPNYIEGGGDGPLADVGRVMFASGTILFGARAIGNHEVAIATPAGMTIAHFIATATGNPLGNMNVTDRGGRRSTATQGLVRFSVATAVTDVRCNWIAIGTQD